MDKRTYWQAKLRAVSYRPRSSGLGTDDILHPHYAGADRPIAWPADTAESRAQRPDLSWKSSNDRQLTHPLGAGKALRIKVPRELDSQVSQTEARNLVLEDQNDNDDIPQLKQTHFRLWRGSKVTSPDASARSELAVPEALVERIPADARCPDHALVDERRLASALAFVQTDSELAAAQDPARQPYLFMFALEPVQAFIEESRTSRDFWTSSMLIAELGFSAMTAVVKHYGADAILSPDLRGNPRADGWFQSTEVGQPSMLKTNAVSTYAGLVPNVFFAIVPRGSKGDTSNSNDSFSTIEDLAKECYAAAQQRWQDCVKVVFECLREKFNEATAAPPNSQWLEQTAFKSLFGAHWTALPWKATLPPAEAINDHAEYGKMFAGRATTNQDLPKEVQESRYDEAPGENRPLQRAERARKARFAAFVSSEILTHYVETNRKVFALTDPSTLLTSHGFDYGLLQHELRARHRLEKSRIERTLPPQHGEKCTQCGHRSAIAGVTESSKNSRSLSRQELRKRWMIVDEYNFGKERLCSVCCVKRYLVEADQLGDVFNYVWGYSPGPGAKARVPFPSTAAVAMQRYLENLLTSTDENVQACLRKFVDKLEESPIRKTAFAVSLPRLVAAAKHNDLARRLLMYDAQFFLPETWSSQAALVDRFKRSFPDDHDDIKSDNDHAKDLAGLAADVQRSFAKASPDERPPRRNKKFAMLAIDGDSMGQLLLGDPKCVGTPWQHVLHSKWIEHMQADPHQLYGPAGWHDLLERERLTGPALHAFISRALGHFAHRIVPWVVEREFGGRLIYAGGDDVVALAPADDALKIAARLQQFYRAAWVIDTQPQEPAWGWRSGQIEASQLDSAAQRRFLILKDSPEAITWPDITWDQIEVPIAMQNSKWQPDLRSETFAKSQLLALLGPAQSLSAGIVYGHYKTPMRTMQQESHRLLNERAKAREWGNRSAVALSHRSRGGPKSEVVFNWEWRQEPGDSKSKVWTAYDILSSLQEGLVSGHIPSRLGYKLREELTRFAPFLEKKQASWQRELIRSLLLDQADGSKLKSTVQGRSDISYLDVLTQALLADKKLDLERHRHDGGFANDNPPAIGSLDLARYLNAQGSNDETEGEEE